MATSSALVIFVGAVAGFNYYMDPLWCFAQMNCRNRFTPSVDARQQKTNSVTFGRQRYDMLIIGSSRTEHVNPEDFVGYHAFNYAAPSMYPEEYKGYIDYFRKHNGSLKTIVLGLDFYGTNRIGPERSDPPAEYQARTNGPFYRLRMLLSMDTLQYSLNAWEKKYTNLFYYDRRNTNKYITPITKAFSEKLRIEQTARFRATQLGRHYQYNSELTDIYHRLAEDNRDCRIVAFITPISRPYFELVIREGGLEDYLRWIRETVGTFGVVYNFMYLNSVTDNSDNFMDLHHFYPRVGAMIAHRIIGIRDDGIPADFGVRVTGENLEAHLRMLREQAREILCERQVAVPALPAS